MPHYLRTDDREEVKKLLKYQVCAECGSRLSAFYDMQKHLPYLQCKDIPQHDGIEREASRYETQGMEALTIKARRDIMNKEFGEGKATALAKYQGVTSLSKQDAMVILESIWPEAPIEEKVRAALLCASYHINPLMKHVFLIAFNKGKKNESWATVMGIGATRLLASRKGSFSYVDDTPRIMTEEEQIRRFGQSYPDRLYVIVKVKDPQTGAEAPGYGWWPLLKEKMVWDDQANRMVLVKKDGKVVTEPNAPYGSDKGNTMFNMACNRAERQALSRLRPGEMPTDIEVIDEAVAEAAKGKGFDIESTATEIEEEVEPEPQEATPEPTGQVLQPSEEEDKAEVSEAGKDETPVSKEDVIKIQSLAKKAAMSMMDLGKMMANELKWQVPDKLSNLKKWQGDKLIEILTETIGKGE